MSTVVSDVVQGAPGCTAELAAGHRVRQARYLLYALQEGGLLVRFYRELLGRLQSDPTGYAALARVVGQDMARFQQRWEAEMLKL